MASTNLLALLISPFLLMTLANSATFTVVNQCSYTVWAAAYPGGGRQLSPGQTWTLNIPAGTTGGRVWGRTGCSFDSNGNGHCQTGDCGGKLACTAYGAPPNTLAEFGLNQFANQDFYDISLVDGFNIPMNFVPTSNRCASNVHCAANLNSNCPNVLRTAGGCLNPCQVFKTDQYCCNSGRCGPTTYSQFFKNACPKAYSYPKDDATSTYTCPAGTNYQVTFCPSS